MMLFNLGISRPAGGDVCCTRTRTCRPGQPDGERDVDLYRIPHRIFKHRDSAMAGTMNDMVCRLSLSIL